MKLERSLAITFALVACALWARAADSRDGVRYFEEKVRPILAEKCYACHSEQSPQPQGGLRLDSPAAILAGGNAGPTVSPGHPERSLLIHVLEYEDAIKMPPMGKLSNDRIAAISEWIRMGAPIPEAIATRNGDDGSAHWAYQAPVSPEVPESVSNWSLTPIDRFVELRLRKEGLKPSPETDRPTLIRRAYFDVVGLPPSAEETRRFAEGDSAEPYEQLVDRLLESKHFGERWARRWLDVARYSDEGFQAKPFPIAWTYRDWVINAFNEDMPYGDFIVRQLAADLVPGEKRHLAALGLLTVGINLPRPTDVPENLDDRIDVVSRGFLGLSVACARCHDHKFDAIPQKDYYSLYSVFLNSLDVLEPTPIETPPNDGMSAFYQKKLAMRREWIRRFKRERLEDHKQEFRQAETLEQYLAAAWEGRNFSNSRLESLSKESNLNLHLLERWRRYLVQRIDNGDSVFADLGDRASLLAKQLADADRSEPWPHAEKEKLRLVLRGPDTPTNVPFEDFWWIQNEGDSNVVKQLGWQYKAVMLEWSLRGGPRHAMIVAEADERQQAFVFVRGNQHDKGSPVEPRFLTALSEGDSFEKGSGRLELARAIASADNPLTARVWVNRVWQNLFGEGLVRTPSDFGERGDAPSHPELLDYLATSFVEDGWSTKKLIRRIMLSRVYRQSSAHAPDCASVDPTNLLLWRQNRRRLDFEALRDSMLFAAGRLDRSVGGPPFALDARPSSPRRSVYAYISREEPSGLMRSFDFSNPEQHTPKRQLTTVPQQALFLLNSPFAAEQARAIVSSLPKQAPADRARSIHRRVLGREPTARELDAARDFVNGREPTAATPQSATSSPWRYGSGQFDPATGNVEAFQAFEFVQGERLQRGPMLPATVGGRAGLTATGGAPGDDLDHAVVRRWISPIEGKVSVSGVLNHPMGAQARRFQYSNGIRGWIVSDRQGILANWTLTGMSASTDLKNVYVGLGEIVDFIVDSRDDYESDEFSWAPVINEESTVDRGQQGRRWSAEDDFSLPQEEPLDVWEQYAQVLMMTNEFTFVD